MATNYACKVLAFEDFNHPTSKQHLRPNDSIGTGFLVSNSIVMTCNHVVPDSHVAKKVYVDFEYAPQAIRRQTGEPAIFLSFASAIWFIMLKTAIALLRLEPVGGVVPGTALTYYHLNKSDLDTTTLYQEPLRVMVLQYPGDGRLQVAINEATKLVQKTGKQPQLQYKADTLGGSSGSPVFSLYGRLIGIHQQSGPPVPPGPGWHGYPETRGVQYWCSD